MGIILTCLAIAWFCFGFVRGEWQRSFYGVLATVTAASLGIGLIFTSWTWTLVPVSAYLFAATVFYLFKMRKQRSASKAKTSRTLRVLTSIPLALFLIASIALPAYILPDVRFEQPGGPYSVGTTTIYLTDQSRLETRTDAEGDFRQLPVQIWYPANVDGEARAPYHSESEVFIDSLSEEMGLPGLLFTGLERARTNSWLGAELAESKEKYPVLIFSHGFLGSRVQNTFLLEELASNGYVVFSVEHAAWAIGTVFPDGSIVKSKESMMSFSSKEDDTVILAEWTKDIRFVTDAIVALGDSAQSSMFGGRLDVDRIGIFGHSYGGINAAHAMAADSRLKAGINMDGYPYGDAHERGGVDRPFLWLSGEGMPSATAVTDAQLQEFGLTKEAYKTFYDAIEPRINAIVRKGYVMKIKGASHFDFTDFSLLSPMGKLVGFSGDLPARETHRIIQEYTKQFFDQYVKEDPSASFDSLKNDHVELITKAEPN